MRRILIALTIAACVVTIYHLIPMRMFTFGLVRQATNTLFTTFQVPGGGRAVFILNIGNLSTQQALEKIGILLKSDATVVGVNYCNDVQAQRQLRQVYAGEGEKLVTCECGEGPGSSSRIVEDGNMVRYFRTDRDDYFENRVAGASSALAERGNDVEMINYKRYNTYFLELREVDEESSNTFTEAIVLVGYFGEDLVFNSDYSANDLTARPEVFDFTNARITPLNPYFGDTNISPDMHDTLISAMIINNIVNDDFVTEVPLSVAVSIILLFSLVNVLLLLIPLRSLTIRILLAFIYFLLINVAAGYLIVLLFTFYAYFLDIGELPTVLLIVSAFCVASMMIDGARVKKTAAA